MKHKMQGRRYADITDAQFNRLTLNAHDEGMKAAKQGARGNSLFHNEGGLHFTEVGDQSRTRRAGWAWSCEFGDVDNDGDFDLYVANGFRTGPLEDDL